MTATATVNRIRRLLQEEEGASMVEYALMLALMAVVIAVAVTVFGRTAADSVYGSVAKMP